MAVQAKVQALRPWQRRLGALTRHGDRPFNGLLLLAAGLVLLVVLAIGWELWRNSTLARNAFGLRFLWTTTWDPVSKQFGALPFLVGTLETSLLALLLSAPVSLGIAVFLSELAPT